STAGEADVTAATAAAVDRLARDRAHVSGMDRTSCYYCGGPYDVARCKGVPCNRCGKPWWGPPAVSGFDVSPDAAAMIDALAEDLAARYSSQVQIGGVAETLAATSGWR